ncbi:MAG: hypothetical protein AAF513_07455 [Pseudomonadota bacterium]
MPNFQVLFSGQVAENANVSQVQENLARELGLNANKVKQLFSGRTVVIRSQLDQTEAQVWQAKLAQLGAVVRIKDLTPKDEVATYSGGKNTADQTLRDITAAHLECPRCGHLQLDTSHCARCGTDLVAAFKQKRKEDLLIEKKIRELREKQHGPVTPTPAPIVAEVDDAPPPKKNILGWLRRG